jgi:hypothetical protein
VPELQYVVVSSKKKKQSAIIEFESQTAAVGAYFAVFVQFLNAQNKALEMERGHADCLLTIEKMADAEDPQLASSTHDLRNKAAGGAHAVQNSTTHAPKYASFPDTPTFAATNSTSYHGVNSDGSTVDINDFESIVLMKMRQAEERKRLIQQINDSDDL